MKERRTWIKEWLDNPVTFITPVFAVVVLAATLPARFQFADLLSHFMAQYTIGAAGLIVLGLLFKSSKQVLALLALLFCFAGYQLLPFLPLASNDPTAGKTLKILQTNVLFINKDPARLRALIDGEKPDLIVTSETPPVFAEMLAGLKSEYPYQDLHPQKGNPRGLGVISKVKLEKAQRIHFDHKGVPSQLFTLRMGEEDITFVSIHPFTPTENIERRDNEFRLIAEKFRKTPVDNLIVLGDFNATPFCTAYKDLLRDTKLRNARDGFGVYPSWPTFLPTPILRIPIDHVLVSSNIGVSQFRTAAHIGSDHLPTITDIYLKAKP